MVGVRKLGRRLILLALFSSSVWAHSWVEQLMAIALNGSFVGTPGYPRGNVLRSNPAFSDNALVYLVPTNEDASLCRDSQQQKVQTEGSPRLQVSAGGAIALRYQENGHVTLPATPPGKPDNRGTVYVYGTTDPKEKEKFQDVHKVWNEDGTGGDARGVLLAKRNYDDGRCYQVNGDSISQRRQKDFPHAPDPSMGNDLWCQSDIAIPNSAPSGKPYTLYWVWDWPTSAAAAPPNGKEEVYTTCMDVDVVDNSDSRLDQAAKYDYDQSLNGASIPEQFDEIYGSRSEDTTSETSSSSSTEPTSPSSTTTAPPSGTAAVPPVATVTVTSYEILYKFVYETGHP
ncbi:hypothetical protein BJX70DRAFT_64917 [Aspergillus crustosus]